LAIRFWNRLCENIIALVLTTFFGRFYASNAGFSKGKEKMSCLLHSVEFVSFVSLAIGEAMRLEGPTIAGLGGIPMTVLFTAAVLVFSAAALIFSAAALVFLAEAEFTPTGCSVDGGDSDVEGWPVDGLICPNAILVQ
jgi:hypothetical protein